MKHRLSSIDTIIIRPRANRGLSELISEVWLFRELLWVLALRNVSVRYSQTTLGIAWVVLQPVLTTLIFTLVFGFWARVPSPNTPYPILVFSGLLLWQYFNRSVTESAGGFQSYSHVISKVYFPRILVLLVVPLAATIDFAVALIVLFGMMIWYGVFPDPIAILAVPVLLVLTGLLAFSISLVLASIGVRRRDIMLALPFVLQLGMYVTPIIYPLTFVPKHLQWVFDLNPMATLIEGLRWALLGASAPQSFSWIVLAMIILVLLIIGSWLFERMESTLVDEL